MTDRVTDNDRLRVGERCNYHSWNVGELKEGKKSIPGTVTEKQFLLAKIVG